MSLMECLLVCLFCMSVVFAVLLALWCAVSLFTAAIGLASKGKSRLGKER